MDQEDWKVGKRENKAGANAILSLLERERDLRGATDVVAASPR